MNSELSIVRRVAGVDEAGRGPLSGPVVAAACVLPEGLTVDDVDDSKKLSAAQRERVFTFLTTHGEISYGLGIVDVEVIDEVNILQATLLAMKEAVEDLDIPPEYLLVDGLHLPLIDIPGEAVVKGDQRFQCIAAASIIAKVTRDRIMEEYHKKWPQYGFKNHKGYGTKKHRKAIEEYGPCPIHRRSFEPIKTLIKSITSLKLTALRERTMPST